MSALLGGARARPKGSTLCLEDFLRRLEPALSEEEIRSEAEVATLRLLDGLRAGRVYVLSRRDTLIGTGPACEVRLLDDVLAERHALIHSVPSRSPVLVDLAGAGNTMVNGFAVSDATLRDGDIVLLGPRIVARFEYRGVIRYEDGPIAGVRVAPSVFRELDGDVRGVASCIARGMLAPEISEALDLTVETVHTRTTALLRQFDAKDRAALMKRLIG